MFSREAHAVIFGVPSHIGYGALCALIFAESAGVPAPGESALITAGLLAGAGHLALPAVIAVGAVAAMLGDNLGYLIGRRGGRAVLLRDGRLASHRRKAVHRADEFFARHGAKTVFFGRWVAGVRIVVAVLAGASAMPWRTFVLYNALGAVAWSATVAGAAALLGPVVAAIIYGTGLAVAGAALVAGVVRARWRRRRASLAAVSP
jgi:undecaprenyl-diphosphatase